MNALCAEINKFGKGVGNTARYRILEALFRGRKTVNKLVGIVKLSQPAVSQHLKTLKECNLVLDERRGQEVFYAINTKYTLTLLKKLAKEIHKQQNSYNH